MLRIELTELLEKQYEAAVKIHSIRVATVQPDCITLELEIEREYFQKERPTSLIERMKENCEVAGLVTYLASPLASNTNGAALRCEGGILRTLFRSDESGSGQTHGDVSYRFLALN